VAALGKVPETSLCLEVAVSDKIGLSVIHFASRRDAAHTRHVASAACPDIPFEGVLRPHLPKPV